MRHKSGRHASDNNFEKIHDKIVRDQQHQPKDTGSDSHVRVTPDAPFLPKKAKKRPS